MAQQPKTTSSSIYKYVGSKYLYWTTSTNVTFEFGAVWVDENALSMFLVLGVLADVACAIFESDHKTKIERTNVSITLS